MQNKGKNKKQNENLIQEKLIQELHKILDNNYFHINTKIKNNTVEWSVFYKNLPTQFYYSNKNKPLLTSSKNTIADIYFLRDIFDDIKAKEINQNISLLYEDEFKYYSAISEIKLEGSSGMLNIFVIYALLNIILIEFNINVFTGFLNLCVCIFISFYFNYKDKKMSKLLEKSTNENIDILLKNNMKNKGLFIYNKLKNELFKNKI